MKFSQAKDYTSKFHPQYLKINLFVSDFPLNILCLLFNLSMTRFFQVADLSVNNIGPALNNKSTKFNGKNWVHFPRPVLGQTHVQL